MEQISITRQALQAMWENSRHCAVETGGALIGALRSPLVLVAGDAGPQAVKSLASFSSDPGHDREVLRRARRRFGRQLNLLGYWHLHPAGMKRPSAGDLQQARKLLLDLQAAGEDQPWLLAFILQPEATPQQAAHPYRLAANAPGFRPLLLEVLDEADPQVSRALQGEPLALLSERREHPWIDPDFHFHLTPAGRQRLEREQAVLEERGYSVRLLQRKNDRRVSFLISAGAVSLLCQFPREYPLGAPRLLRWPDCEELPPFAGQLLWNSDRSVAELLEGLAGPAGGQAAPAGPNPSSPQGEHPSPAWPGPGRRPTAALALAAILALLALRRLRAARRRRRPAVGAPP